jgi:peroxiredoxin
MADRRILIPIIAGVVIASVSTWRVMSNRTQDFEAQLKLEAAKVVTRSAADLDFEALDPDNHMVRLAAFLGRHRVLILFFDGELGADKDVELLRLRERYAELKARDVKVIAVSTALPQQNRLATGPDRAGEFPFPLVSDFNPVSAEEAHKIHRRWGRWDDSTDKAMPGVFVIDRKGQVPFVNGVPKPFENVDRALESLVR